MQKLWFGLGILGVLSLTGAGCNFTSLEDASGVDDSDSIATVQRENERLKEDLQDLEKKLDRMEDSMKDQEQDVKEDTMEQKADEDQDSLSQPWYVNATPEELDQAREDYKNNEFPKNERGREVISEPYVVEDLDPKRSDIFIVVTDAPNPAQSESPSFRFGCDEYLYQTSVQLDEDKTQSDLATAIVQLLTYKPAEGEGLNPVRGKGFLLDNVRYEDGKRIVEFTGEEISTGGVCEDARIKAVIEETVALYSSDFEIWLNGSAKEWECLFDQSGMCS